MADVSENAETNVNQNNEVTSTKSEFCDKVVTGVSNSSDSGSESGPVTFGASSVVCGVKNHFTLRSSVLGSPLPKGKSGSELPGKSVPFTLNPPRLSNPFAKPDVENKNQEKETNSDSCKENETKVEDKTNLFNSKGEAGKSTVSFVPLKSEAKSQSGPFLPPPPSLGFVFGENLHERVESAQVSENSSAEKDSEVSSGSGDCKEVKTNGTTVEMLFTAVAKREVAEKVSESGNKTLSEAAREYEEARAVKRKYEAVTVVTGEEEESNIIQMNCKLFAFDNTTSSWVERGRGTLRLNDLPGSPTRSRLIVRAAGSLRLVLNTKIWAAMSVGRASLRSLRITAMDSSQVIKVFLIMASPKEIDQLQKALEWRVNNSKRLSDADDESPSKKTKTEHQDNS